MLTFEELFAEVVVRFDAAPDTRIEADGVLYANDYVHFAWLLTEERITTREEALELIQDMVRNYEVPNASPRDGLEFTDWVGLAVQLFVTLVEGRVESDPVLERAERRRSVLVSVATETGLAAKANLEESGFTTTVDWGNLLLLRIGAKDLVPVRAPEDES